MMFNIPRDKHKTPILQPWQAGDWVPPGEKLFRLGDLLVKAGFFSRRAMQRMGKRPIVLDFPAGTGTWRTWVTDDLQSFFALPSGTCLVFSTETEKDVHFDLHFIDVGAGV